MGTIYCKKKGGENVDQIKATFKNGVFVITLNGKLICSCQPKELKDTLEELADTLDDKKGK
jgi:hypothetical protein